MNTWQRIAGSLGAGMGVICFAAGMTMIAEHHNPWVSFICAALEVCPVVWILTQPVKPQTGGSK